MEQSVTKLAGDTCYPENIMDEFKSLRISSTKDILPAHNLMLLIIASFNGDAVESFNGDASFFVQ